MDTIEIDDKPQDPGFVWMADLSFTAGFTSCAASKTPTGAEATVRNRDTNVAITIRVDDLNRDRAKHDAMEIARRVLCLITDDKDTASVIRGEQVCDDCGRRAGSHNPDVEH